LASTLPHSTFGPLSFGPSPATISVSRNGKRAALVVSADASFRQRLRQTLAGLRWQVREAATGAQAWAAAEGIALEAVIVDSWLPDLDLGEFLREFQASFAGVEVLTTEPAVNSDAPRSPWRQELLYALRAVEDQAPVTDTAAWNAAPAMEDSALSQAGSALAPAGLPDSPRAALPEALQSTLQNALSVALPDAAAGVRREAANPDRLPELIGNTAAMLEVSRRVRLVAPRSTPVLIEGPTGSGKELVAQALHRLSSRSRKAFVALNCAAIPEALLEAELFGHTRGAFTGAVHGRTGRIETADGGTLFLDEIGEMPLALQSKLLRFVECGELQRVGDNETVKVDVRIIAATHRPLGRNAAEGLFRSDLYFRLAVFLIRTPSLAERSEDLPQLVGHFLEKMGRTEPVKRIDAAAMEQLAGHAWPGNVRELEHVLERAAILAGDAPVITAGEIDFGAHQFGASGN
jgi:DNA-binding NtrC family response regulator